MAFGSDRSANFVIAAKDAATKPIGNVGKAMGRLRGAAGTAFKAIAAGAVIAATALAAFTATAIKGAMSEEQSIIKTNAALRQRGFDLDALGPKVEAQVKAFEKYGLEGENVREGIEVASRFFKDQNVLLEANAAAANIAAVTGQSLGDVMRVFGRAAMGSMRGLQALGVEIKDGATATDIINAANERYLGLADELANSTSGKFLAAQEKFNGAMDEFGLKLLPLVQEGLTFLTEKALPVFQDLMADLGPIVGNLVDNFVRPLVDSFANLFSLFDSSDGSFSILELALEPLKIALNVIRGIIDAIVAGLKIIGVGGGLKTQRLDRAAAGAGYSGGPRATSTPMRGGGGGGGGGGSSYLQVNNSITLGRDATSSVNTQLGRAAKARGGKRTP